MPSVFDNAVKRDGSKPMLVEHEQPKEQILSAQKSPDDCKTLTSLKEKLYKKYGKSTTTWPNNMPLDDMEQMVKFKCFLSRPEDAVAMKVMERLFSKDSAHKQVCTLQFTLFQFKRLSPHMLVT